MRLYLPSLWPVWFTYFLQIADAQIVVGFVLPEVASKLQVYSKTDLKSCTLIVA